MEETLTLTAERLRKLLSYEPATGIFRKIAIDGISYIAQRLAVLHVTGQWPAKSVPRRNLDREDNRWQNICAA
jgi:hypothetical protein